jgi:hypothetical protein
MDAIVIAAVAVAGLSLIDPPTEAPPKEKPPAKAPITPSAPEDGKPKPAAPVSFPHPMITEVLYAVPNSPEGDANKDGTRQVAGDEFIELVNPHDKPIQLLGYTVIDRNPEKKGQMKFTFPAFELPPGGVVVVFNGCESTWSGVGPVGDAQKAPTGPNESFDNAFVFTARIPSSRTSWANNGDYALLSDPGSQPIHVVSWGTFKESIPEAALVETAPVTTKASVQRESLTGAFTIHRTAEKEPKVAFSPGRFELPKRETVSPPK